MKNNHRASEHGNALTADPTHNGANSYRPQLTDQQKIDALWHELVRTREELGVTKKALAEAQREIRDLIRLDELTGLPNYHAFVERVGEEVKRASRFKTSMSVLLLDLDNLQALCEMANIKSDDVLRHVAGLLQKNTRTVDTVARYGQTQFGVILPNTNQDGATLLAERLSMTIEGYQPSPEVEYGLMASFGVTTLTGDYREGKSCIGEAYKAMRYSSMSGSNRVTHAQQTHIDRVVPWGDTPGVRLIDAAGELSHIKVERGK